MQARSLAGGKSRVLGLIYSSDVENEPNSFYYAGIELGALRACGQDGLADLVADVRSAIEHARNRNARHSGQCRHIVDCRLPRSHLTFNPETIFA
jgi:LacI family transcriptional regulator